MDEPPNGEEPVPPAPSTPAPTGDLAAPTGDPGAPTGDPGAPVDWSTATAVQPAPRRNKLVLAGLGLAGVALVGLVWMITGGSPSNDPYDAAARDVGEKLLAMPEFKARYGDVTSEDRAFEIGQEIALKGIPKLGDADLLRYWQLTNRMIGVADPTTCGRIFRQTAKPADAKNAARALDIESFKALLDVTVLAFQADLRGEPVKPVPSSTQLSTAFAALQTAMGPSMADAAAKLGDTAASDADVCTAGRSFLGAVLALGEPDRTVIARYMIATAAGQ